jgi:hypothetical protein
LTDKKTKGFFAFSFALGFKGRLLLEGAPALFFIVPCYTVRFFTSLGPAGSDQAPRTTRTTPAPQKKGHVKTQGLNFSTK